MSPDDLTSWLKDVLQNPDIKQLVAETLSDITGSIQSNRSRIDDLEEEMAAMRIEMEEQKQYSRRNAIRVSNSSWPAENRQEDTDAMVLDVFRNTLGLTTISHNDISRSHRVGRTGQRQRPILVKFTRYRIKEKIMKKKSSLPDGMFIYDDLSPYISNFAYEARQLKRARRIADTWVYDGRVYVKATSRDLKGSVVHSVDHLNSIVPPEGTLVTFANAATHRRNSHTLAQNNQAPTPAPPGKDPPEGRNTAAKSPHVGGQMEGATAQVPREKASPHIPPASTSRKDNKSAPTPREDLSAHTSHVHRPKDMQPVDKNTLLQTPQLKPGHLQYTPRPTGPQKEVTMNATSLSRLFDTSTEDESKGEACSEYSMEDEEAPS